MEKNQACNYNAKISFQKNFKKKPKSINVYMCKALPDYSCIFPLLLRLPFVKTYCKYIWVLCVICVVLILGLKKNNLGDIKQKKKKKKNSKEDIPDVLYLLLCMPAREWMCHF